MVDQCDWSESGYFSNPWKVQMLTLVTLPHSLVFLHQGKRYL